MENALIVIGLVVALALTLAVWVLFGSRGRKEPLEVGRETVEREDRPRAEKEQMDAPQPEFIEDGETSSSTRK